MKNLITYYGIDVSKESLQIAQQLADGTWQESNISNEINVIEEWLSKIDLSENWFVFEYTGTYAQRLCFCLNLLDANFTIITPAQSKGFGQTLKKISKTDRQDAIMLALYGQKMTPTQTILPDVNLQQKRQKYKYFSSLKADKQAFINRIHALSYDPNADKFVLKSIQEMMFFLDTQITEINRLLFTIDDQEFKRIEKLMMHVVGIGKVSATALILSTNGFENFTNAKEVSKFIGTAPTDRQSGSSIKGKGSINKSGVAYVRTTLYLAAINAARYNNACKDLYTRLRTKGKPFKVAIIAVVNKLIKQVFAVVKNNTVFDNSLCLTK
jgi:transposase